MKGNKRLALLAAAGAAIAAGVWWWRRNSSRRVPAPSPVTPGGLLPPRNGGSEPATVNELIAAIDGGRVDIAWPAGGANITQQSRLTLRSFLFTVRDAMLREYGVENRPGRYDTGEQDWEWLVLARNGGRLYVTDWGGA